MLTHHAFLSAGIVPVSCDELFKRIEAARAKAEKGEEYQVHRKCSGFSMVGFLFRLGRVAKWSLALSLFRFTSVCWKFTTNKCEICWIQPVWKWRAGWKSDRIRTRDSTVSCIRCCFCCFIALITSEFQHFWSVLEELCVCVCFFLWVEIVLFFPVEGLKSESVSSYREIDAKMNEGTKNRTVASTNMNATSRCCLKSRILEFSVAKKSLRKTEHEMKQWVLFSVEPIQLLPSTLLRRNWMKRRRAWQRPQSSIWSIWQEGTLSKHSFTPFAIPHVFAALFFSP